jgi:hypothetical protein
MESRPRTLYEPRLVPPDQLLALCQPVKASGETLSRLLEPGLALRNQRLALGDFGFDLFPLRPEGVARRGQSGIVVGHVSYSVLHQNNQNAVSATARRGVLGRALG